MKKAFTMIEIIFVIVIIGILSGIAIPKMLGLRTDAKITNLKEQVASVKSGIENISRTTTLASLETSSDNSYPSAELIHKFINKKNYIDIKSANEKDINNYTYLASIKGFGDFTFVYVDGKVSKPGAGIIPSSAKVGDFVCVKPNVEKCKLFNQ